VDSIMAFIDWLRKQHADSLRASQRMAADPFLKGIKPGAMNFPGPPVRDGLTAEGILPFQKTQPGFFARDYKEEDLVKKVMIEKNDGTKEIKSEWEERRFPVHQGNVRVSALPSEPVMGPGRELPPGRVNPAGSLDLRLDPSRWGGQTGQIENPMAGGMMWKDPGWLGVPQARAAPAPRRVQPRVSGPMNTRPGTVGGSLNHPASIANIGMPQVADLRNRIAAIDRQQAAIPRQQMPPPRFVPPVDPSQFPIISPGQIAGATYDAGDPRVQMSGGFDWSGQALRENVGEDLRGIWSPIKERMDKILEDIRKRREGQTMAPFDWRNN
jgi:hypothetical protein